MDHEKVCVECRWCEHGSAAGDECALTGDPLEAGAAIHAPACRAFEPPPPAPYWGP